MNFEQQIFIRCPLPTVFAYMDEVAREPEWQPGILEAWKEPQGKTVPGTRKHYVSEFMGRRIRNTYVTRVFEPNRRAVYETTSDSVLRARAELTWSETQEGTSVTMAFEGKVGGPLRFVPQRMLEGVYRKEMENSLGLLKTLLESER